MFSCSPALIFFQHGTEGMESAIMTLSLLNWKGAGIQVLHFLSECFTCRVMELHPDSVPSKKVKPFISTQGKMREMEKMRTGENDMLCILPISRHLSVDIPLCSYHRDMSKGFYRCLSIRCWPLVFCRACHRMCCLLWILGMQCLHFPEPLHRELHLLTQPW